MSMANDAHNEKAIEENTESNLASEESPPLELGSPKRSLLSRLRLELPQLSPTERQIGEFVLEQPRLVLRLPMDQLAREIGVSQGTLSNFSQALGYNGFKAFRLDLAAEVNSPINLDHSAIVRGDSLQEVVNKTVSANIDAMLTTLKSLDVSEIEKSIEVIKNARRIELYGLGISSTPAHTAFNRFQSLGLTVNWLPDISHQITSALLMSSQDVAMAFSSSGETKEVIRALSVAHEQGATTIAVTGNPHSALIRYADIRLVVTPREPTTFVRNLRISSALAMHCIMDIIYLGIINSFEDSEFERVEKIYRLFNEPPETQKPR